MRWTLMVAAVVIMVIAQAPVQAVPFAYLYDDFNDNRIDPDRWQIIRPSGYEMTVEEVRGRLKLELREYGEVRTGPSTIPGNIWVVMANDAAAAAVGIQTTVRIEDREVTGCGDAGRGRVRARMFADLFRAGSNPGNIYDYTNVVEALFQITARSEDPKSVLKVSWVAERYIDPAGDVTDWSMEGSFPDVALGQDVTLGIELDRANHRIIFTKDNEDLQAAEYPEWWEVNFDPPQNALGKAIVVAQRLDTCPVRTTGWIRATFDEVRIIPMP